MSYTPRQIVLVNNKRYEILTLLGKGKGGFSYLCKSLDNDNSYPLVVLKQIHHEPCPYYQFSNKIESERNDYNTLLKASINIPRMIDIDISKEIVIKEYIDGDVISDLINNKDHSFERYIPQVISMSELAQKNGINIDYYPTNFVVRNNVLFYIDYECNPYMEEWSYQKWGSKYWKIEE